MTTLPELIKNLAAAKAIELAANAARLEIEQQIIGHPDVWTAVKLEGTTSFKALGLSITTGFSRSWEQASLLELQRSIKEEFFPFKTELKEDRNASKVLEERFPELWQQLSSALTLKPKKPTLTLKGESA